MLYTIIVNVNVVHNNCQHQCCTQLLSLWMLYTIIVDINVVHNHRQCQCCTQSSLTSMMYTIIVNINVTHNHCQRQWGWRNDAIIVGINGETGQVQLQ